MTRSSVNQKVESVKEIFSIVRSDVYGPMTTPARNAYKYFVTFTDDYSRFRIVYLIRRKSNSFKKL
jgi:hypothetical protein